MATLHWAQLFKTAQCRGCAICRAHLLPWMVADRTGERERHTASGLRQHPAATQTVRCGRVSTLLAAIPNRARRSWENPARQKNRNNSHELRDFIVLPSSVWASHRNELRQEQAACKQAALARAPGDDTKSVLGKRFRTTRRSRGGAARGGGTPSSTSRAPESSARRRTSARMHNSTRQN